MSVARNTLSGLIAVASFTCSGGVFAQDYYLSLSAGVIDQHDSGNAGVFADQFVTGEVTGVSPPLTIPAGSAVGWNTEFDTGSDYGAAFGGTSGPFRLEFEYRNTDADVDTHTGVRAGDIDLSDIDAGVLIAGNRGDLGVTVAELMANGRGQLETSRFMANAYYDVDLEGAFTPYVGLGLGNADSDVVYAPSDTAILKGGDDGFAWQALLGASYGLSESIDLFVNYRYFEAGDLSVDSSLLPAAFEIENDSQTLDVGLRLSF